MLRKCYQKEKALSNIEEVFEVVFDRLKEKNREKWAARVICNWWRERLDYWREVERKRWLPLNLDLEKASFSDVSRILKVLDDYALKKLATYE